jgi:hypothetical protein
MLCSSTSRQSPLFLNTLNKPKTSNAPIMTARLDLRPAPLFHSFSSPQTHFQHHHHFHPSTSTSIPVTPTQAQSSSSSSPAPHILNQSHLKPCRPKISANKKPTSSSNQKTKSVQKSLEVKVERAKGFHAFFVPLARSMPPAPPSSPVLRPRDSGLDNIDRGPSEESDGFSIGDYFGSNCQGFVKGREIWVEDVSEESGMEVDSE